MDPLTQHGEAPDAAVMAGYQRLLRAVIDGQRDVVLGYLGQGTVDGAAPAARARNATGGGPARQSRPLPLAPPGSIRWLASDVLELSRELDLDCDLYLDHHRLDGRPVLPAAMAMELMAEAALCCRPELEVAEIRGFQVLRGIGLDAGPLPLRVAARLQHASAAPSGAEVQVEIRAGGDAASPRYRATIGLAERLPQAEVVEPPPLTGLRPFPLEVADVYERWLFHGPLFAAIGSVDGVCERGIRARLRPSHPQRCLAGDAAGSWLVDPVVIDGSFQMVILWSRLHNDMTPLPSRFDRYLRLGNLDGPELCCEISVVSRSGGRSLTTRHLFTNSDGTAVGLLEGMESTCSSELNRLAGGSAARVGLS